MRRWYVEVRSEGRVYFHLVPETFNGTTPAPKGGRHSAHGRGGGILTQTPVLSRKTTTTDVVSYSRGRPPGWGGVGRVGERSLSVGGGG